MKTKDLAAVLGGVILEFGDEMTPSSHEIDFTLTFYGADKGAFAASPPAGSTAFTLKLNSLSFDGGETWTDFSSAQDRVALMRFVKQASSISFTLPKKIRSKLLSRYQTYGPLVRALIESNSPITASDDETLQLDGAMQLPNMDFISNPGTVTATIVSYGVVPILTSPAL